MAQTIFYNAPSYRFPAFITASLLWACNILSSQLPSSLVVINVSRMEITSSAENGPLKEGIRRSLQEKKKTTTKEWKPRWMNWKQRPFIGGECVAWILPFKRVFRRVCVKGVKCVSPWWARHLAETCRSYKCLVCFLLFYWPSLSLTDQTLLLILHIGVGVGGRPPELSL